MPQIKSSFILRSKAPNFERDSFNTLSSMRNVNPGWIDEGHISYCRETRKHYVFSSYNEYDETTGYFRLFVTNTQSGGSGECSCGVNRVFNTLEDMRNVSMISGDIDLGSIVYCKETKLPYYSDYDPKLPPLDSNQAYFDDETGYFRSFSVNVDVKDLQDDLNDLVNRVTNLENNGPSLSEDYVTEEELNNKGYLTEIPEGYITEEELNNKGYITANDIPEIPEDYVTDSELAEALKNFEDSLEGLGVSGLTVDADKGWLRATGQDTSGNTKNYFIALTELVKPNAPTISTTNYSIVTGNANVTVTNNAAGSTMYYSVDGGTSWVTTSGTVSIVSGFENSKDNTTKTQSLWVKAIKNGEESDINEYTITITPKVATGSVSYVRNNNNNNYSTSAIITLSISPSKDAKSEYSVDGGETWSEFDKDDDGKYVNTTITVTSSVSASVYQVKATKTGYDAADVVSNTAFTLNAKKAYYGFSTKAVLINEEDIKSLIGGGTVETNKLSGAYTITPTGEDNGYIWLCCASTLTPGNIVANKGDVIPFGFNDKITINGWNCYRNSNLISPVITNIYIP